MKLRFAVVASFVLSFAGPVDGGELLYNGIELPDEWPPRDVRFKRFQEGAPAPVPPYLVSPPKVIPIDVGRQLFVDDYLIESTTLRRSFHRPQYYEKNPVLKPDKAWETHSRLGPMAMPFSGGVFWDPQAELFKMWHMAGYNYNGALSVSKDGLKWEKPNWGFRGKSNLIKIPNNELHGVWLDLEERDPVRRYKMVWHRSGDYSAAVSADGILWNVLGKLGRSGDRCSLGYNPFRKVWIYSLRHGWGRPRARRYAESKVFGDANWYDNPPPFWTGADRLDGMRPELKTPPQLYNLDCAGYESVMLGLFTIYRGNPRDDNDRPEALTNAEVAELSKPGRPKLNEISVGFSRDGFHWSRPDREPFLPVSEQRGAWNWGNVQSAGGCCLVVGDRLHFYVSGRAGLAFPKSPGEDSGGTTGLAFLRRDGFASMDAGTDGGSLTTRPIRFGGKYLFVNADNSAGKFHVEVLDKSGKVIPGFELGRSAAPALDKTIMPVIWKGARLGSLAGQTVRFRFRLTKGQLYSFWVSPDASGASYGYLAGGGPGYPNQRDTVGQAALDFKLGGK
jgi:hypothetical protein